MRERMIFTVVGIFLICLALPASTYAQTEAYTVPKSNRTISGELTFPGECKARSAERPNVLVKVPCKARFTVQDGTWVTVEKAGYFYGFLGQINDSTEKPNFIPYQLNRLAPGQTAVKELDPTGSRSTHLQDPARDIDIGQKVTFNSARGVKLLVTGTGTSMFEAPFLTDASLYREPEAGFGYSTSNTCCVTCQGGTVCASSVETSCGSCSAGGGGGRGWPI